MRIVKSITFDAAHYLADCPDARPYARMHGHSFTLEVAIDGEPDPETGWVVDLGDVAEALAELRDSLDHRLLNEVEGLGRPTLENICRYAAERLRARFPGLARVRVARPSCGEACEYEL
ncbi:6-pyruvoyl trahydropterin synthase family protein [Amphiplicatus metriothermophilus]|uniref:6-carboxy-5,6,7,8-tetrahydropterin synthase n=1 Tax=Amphiplicatus metriothermophilus TaxID=1519374 RepID=A0A239PP92_9PROT|nr:6-carboxytetrahydropterin synthase [Amphiplicatus metriothermophilus]MBB5518722.1 6-pyruvoyltetrahydropterin/6-carboxytetrahydropterin synthase [Amphiplicatus metriothermophilus]SNT72121.1 6-pyruvoyltetrahydropterin/6-carboxytetrahydropterin synthase [Amphiplicatus metriothermophilus]